MVGAQTDRNLWLLLSPVHAVARSIERLERRPECHIPRNVIRITALCDRSVHSYGYGESKIHSVRIVVQHISEPRRNGYRLVAYGDEENYGKVEFDSRSQLRSALGRTLPSLIEQVPFNDDLSQKRTSYSATL